MENRDIMVKVIESQMMNLNRGFLLVELLTGKLICEGDAYTSFDELNDEPIPEIEIQMVNTHDIKLSILADLPLHNFSISGLADCEITYIRPIVYKKAFEDWWDSVKKEEVDD